MGLTTFMLLSSFLFAQTRTITGQVRDANGNPVSFATISIKGSTTGTSADVNGNFSIAANTGDVLVVSAINFDQREVTVT